MIDAPLTLSEYAMNEAVPLATLFRAVFDFLAARKDAVVFGSQAVNVYAAPPRMTEDIDVLSTSASALAEALRAHLNEAFHVATRVREVVPGGFRVYQVQRPKNRRIVDVRQVAALPPSQKKRGVRVLCVPNLLAMKIIGYVARANTLKGLTDLRDIHALLNAYPKLRQRRDAIEALLPNMSSVARHPLRRPPRRRRRRLVGLPLCNKRNELQRNERNVRNGLAFDRPSFCLKRPETGIGRTWHDDR